MSIGLHKLDKWHMQTDQPEGRYSYFDMRWPEPGPAPGWPSGWGMKISFWCWTVCICWSGGLKRCWQRSFSSSPSESMALQSCQYWWKGCRWEGRKRSLQGKAAQSCPDWVFRWHLHSSRDVGQELRDLCCNLGFRLWKKGLERPCEWKTEPSDCVHWDKDGTQEQTLRAPFGLQVTLWVWSFSCEEQGICWAWDSQGRVEKRIWWFTVSKVAERSTRMRAEEREAVLSATA